MSRISSMVTLAWHLTLDQGCPPEAGLSLIVWWASSNCRTLGSDGSEERERGPAIGEAGEAWLDAVIAAQRLSGGLTLLVAHTGSHLLTHTENRNPYAS